MILENPCTELTTKLVLINNSQKLKPDYLKIEDLIKHELEVKQSKE